MAKADGFMPYLRITIFFAVCFLHSVQRKAAREFALPKRWIPEPVLQRAKLGLGD